LRSGREVDVDVVDPGGHVELLLGLYVVGGLEPEERQRVELHVPRCSRCRHEWEEIRDVPAYLSLLAEEDIAELAACHERYLSGSAAPVPEPPRS
jgi:anti-sigma factor RsiW